jgi:glycosyltransferase 2 family protein
VLGKYRKFLEFGVLVLLAAGLLWWFGRTVDWHQVGTALEHSDWRFILLACVIIAIAYLFRAYRWRALLAPLCRADLREVWIATTVGFGAVLAIGRAGEVVRPVVLPMRDRKVRPAAAFVTIVIERIYDSMTVAFVFALNLLWLQPTTGDINALARVKILGLVMVGALAVTIAALIWFRLNSARIISWVEGREAGASTGRVKRAILGLLDQLARALRVMSHARDLAITIGWTLVMWGSVALANLVIFRAFNLQVSGHSLGYAQALFILGWSMVGSAVPTPGGAAGAFHLATATGLIFLGVDRAEALAVAIVLHLVDFGPAALFGLFYLLRGEINWARLKELIKSEAVEHAVEDEKIPEKLINSEVPVHGGE